MSLQILLQKSSPCCSGLKTLTRRICRNIALYCNYIYMKQNPMFIILIRLSHENGINIFPTSTSKEVYKSSFCNLQLFYVSTALINFDISSFISKGLSDLIVPKFEISKDISIISSLCSIFLFLLLLSSCFFLIIAMFKRMESSTRYKDKSVKLFHRLDFRLRRISFNEYPIEAM